MVNYLKCYSDKLMKLCEPLKPLLRENVHSTHQDTFDLIKEELTKTPVLMHFHPNSLHVIQTDTVERIGCSVVLQLVHPLACTIELWEVLRARKKLKSITEGNSSFLSALQTSHVLHNSIVHS